MTCEDCKFFVRSNPNGGNCFRYPKPVGVVLPHWCGEHHRQEPSDEVLSSLLTSYKLSPLTIVWCRRQHFFNVLDAAVGLSRLQGKVDTTAVSEVKALLLSLGVQC
jgi:hypothetical protein